MSDPIAAKNEGEFDFGASVSDALGCAAEDCPESFDGVCVTATGAFARDSFAYWESAIGIAARETAAYVRSTATIWYLRPPIPPEPSFMALPTRNPTPSET